MPAIVITGFQGEQPRIVPRLLPPNAAQDAINVRLADGGLTPTRASTPVGADAVAGAKTIVRHGASWLSWTGVVHAAAGPVDQSRLYITGDGAPKMRTSAGVVYPLAVPRPASAPTATVQGVGAGDVVTRTYVYTFVTEFGEEGEPSAASAAVDWRPGNNVLLSDIQAPPAGRGITRQRFYRTQTGAQGTFFYLIADRSASALNFSDVVPPNAFAEPLPSVDWNPPPAALQGLTAMPNGMMAGFVGKDLYFCEPFRPHAWPEKYVLTTDYDIVGLGAIGPALIVATKGTPYIAVGGEPAAMQMARVEQNLPCINARGIVDLGFAICYPTWEGLVAVNPGGAAQIVTANLFSRDDWLSLKPNQMVAAQIAGRYAAFYNVDSGLRPQAGCVIIDISGQQPWLSRSDVIATAAWFDTETGGLYYLPKASASIQRLDSPEGPPTLYYWRSKPFVIPAPDNFGIVLVDVDLARNGEEIALIQAQIEEIIARNAATIASRMVRGAINTLTINSAPLGGDMLERLPKTDVRLSVTISADGRQVASTAVVNRPVRLPAGFKARAWEVSVSGDVRVERITLASTVADLVQSPPG
ncbi:hypothetical protein [Microcystis phage Mwe-JY25]